MTSQVMPPSDNERGSAPSASLSLLVQECEPRGASHVLARRGGRSQGATTCILPFNPSTVGGGVS